MLNLLFFTLIVASHRRDSRHSASFEPRLPRVRHTIHSDDADYLLKSPPVSFSFQAVCPIASLHGSPHASCESHHHRNRYRYR